MIFDNWKNLLYIVVILISLIFLVTGFLIGYYYTDKSCIENPLSYGIKKINKMNNINLTCSCFSPNGEAESFFFNENNIQ